MNKDFAQLRKRLDGSDTFMNRGHQIKKVRGREKEIPAWALSDEETRKIMLKAFPKLLTDPKQRKSAARWAAVVHLFYRMNMSKSGVAHELKIRRTNVNRIVQRLKDHASGKSKSRGRPKKEVLSPHPM